MLWDKVAESIDQLKCSAAMLKVSLRNTDPVEGLGYECIALRNANVRVECECFPRC